MSDPTCVPATPLHLFGGASSFIFLNENLGKPHSFLVFPWVIHVMSVYLDYLVRNYLKPLVPWAGVGDAPPYRGPAVPVFYPCS